VRIQSADEAADREANQHVRAGHTRFLEKLMNLGDSLGAARNGLIVTIGIRVTPGSTGWIVSTDAGKLSSLRLDQAPIERERAARDHDCGTAGAHAVEVHTIAADIDQASERRRRKLIRRRMICSGHAPDHQKAECNISKQKITTLLLATLLSSSIACSHKTLGPATLPNAPSDNSFLDLKAGGRLRIIVPVVKSGGYQVAAEPAKPLGDTPQGKTMVLSGDGLAGYEISRYSINRAAGGRVRLRFTSAQITKEGATVEGTRAPALPFALPSAAEHIRLIYLIRNSRADHNMAITASRDLDALNAFTTKVRVNPEACKQNGAVSCVWVPAGIAVRPE
jgi:hypothetical protein